MSMNQVTVSGTLPRDPDVRALESGALVCEFSLAVAEAFWSAQAKELVTRSSFFGCVAWGDLASYAGDHFHRGDEVLVMGQLTQEKYVDRNEKEQSKTKIRVLQISPIRRARTSTDPDF